MSFTSHIEKVREGLLQGQFISEAAVSQGIILPTLKELGWPVFDTSVVIPEFTVQNRRVDYALCHPAYKPSIFIEVKKPGTSDGADRQLFEYAFHEGVPMAILTNGQEWSFYLPGEQGRYDERRVYKLDLVDRSIDESNKRLQRYLGYKNVCSNEALKEARKDYQDIARVREIESNLPKAWAAMLKELDSLLLDLLAERVEDFCGYKPDLDVCSQFLEKQLTSPQSSNSVTTPSIQKSDSKIKLKNQSHVEQSTQSLKSIDKYSLTYKGKVYSAKSAREVMTTLFQVLAEEDKNFLERFASRKHGKKRRYLAKNKFDLYPGRPDLAENNSFEVSPGWWLGTNYSRRNIQDIIDMALEVADLEDKNSIHANVT